LLWAKRSTDFCSFCARIYSPRGCPVCSLIERLAHSNEPILNVAIALGFDSQQSFNRSFKRQYGHRHVEDRLVAVG
jgi:glutaredoxin